MINRFLRAFWVPSDRVWMMMGVGSSVLNRVFDMMPPVLTGWIIDSVSGNPPWVLTASVGVLSPLASAMVLSGLAVFIFGLESVFQWGYHWSFATLAQRLVHRIRMHVLGHMQQREMAFFDTHRLGDTLATVTDDVAQLERFITNGLNEWIQLGVLLVVSVIIMLSISWQLALVAFFPIPVIVMGSLWYQRQMAPRFLAVRDRMGALNARLENWISGMVVVKSFTAEPMEHARATEASKAVMLANRSVISMMALYVPVIRMAVVVGFAGVLLIGSYWVLTGKGVLSLGELVLFAMLTERLLWPVTRLGATFDELERSNASATRIDRVLVPSAVTEVTTPHRPSQVMGHLVFQGVSFSYPTAIGIPVLQGFSLDIKPGSVVGIAGATGCGKSTLVKLLLRFYDPQQGTILLDGVPIDQWAIRSLRHSIALVSQEVYLFHGTIYDNIAYGFPHATPEQVESAARCAAFHDVVTQFEQGYHTIVGERGIRLSGGQRQRLSIARAVLKNAPVLVFDEATSSVDTETEEAIQRQFATVTQGKTAIVIAHRLSTIRHADRIVVLNQGMVAEDGSHAALLRQGGLYARLWATQVGHHA